MKDKNKKVFNRIICILILLIPSFIEKFCFPGEFISISRFIVLQSLAIIICLYISKYKFKYIKKIFKYFKKLIQIINEQWNKFISKKIINKIFLVLPKNIFVFIFFVISIITIGNFYKANNGEVIYEQSKPTSIVGAIVDKEYRVDFSKAELNKKPTDVCFVFATYDKKINSVYRFELYHNDNLIRTLDFNSNVLKDNDYYCFALDSELNENNYKEYYVKFVPIKVDIENAFTLYKNDDSDEVVLKFVQAKSIFSIKTLFLALFIIIFLLLNYFINKKKFSVEKMWILYSLLYIVPIMFIIPPYQVPDEPFHFYNSYQLSQIDITNASEYIYDGEFEVPSNIDCLDYASLNEKDSVDDIESISNCFKSENNTKIKLEDRFISPDYKVGFILSSLAIKLADIFTNSPMIIFYLGRIFNLVLSIVIVYFAIKITPKYKEMFLTLGLMPMFIQQMISYSYDSLLNSICLLIIGLCLAMAAKDKVPIKKYYLVFTLCSIVIINIKYIYLPLLLFVMIANDKNFENNKKKKYLYLLGCLAISFVFAYLISLLFTVGHQETTVLVNNVNLHNIMQNPISIFKIAENTLDKHGMFYLRGLFGYFGWFKFRMDDIFMYAYIIYFVYLVLSNSNVVKKTYKKVILLLSLLMMFAAVFAALYFACTDPNVMYVEGVQGRYFLPLLVPFLFLLTPKKEKIEQDLNISYNFVNIVLLQYTLMLLIFYY